MVLEYLRWLVTRIAFRHFLILAVGGALLLSEVTITIQPRWRAQQNRRELEDLAHLVLTVDQLNSRIYALEQTESVAFGVVTQAFVNPGHSAAVTARQQQQLRDKLEEVAMNQRLLLERYRPK